MAHSPSPSVNAPGSDGVTSAARFRPLMGWEARACSRVWSAEMRFSRSWEWEREEVAIGLQWELARRLGDAARRAIPMPPEDLLEAGVLVYLDGLGVRG